MSKVPEPRWDPISAVLQTLKLKGLFYCRSELSGRWGLHLPPMQDQLWFHVMMRGECELESRGEVLHLRAGDICLLPHGAGHELRSEPDAETPNVLELEHEMADDHYAVLRHGTEGEEDLLICGTARLDHHSARELLEILPAIIELSPQAQSRDWILATVELMASEAQGVRLGTDTMLTRLADVLIVQVIRDWIVQNRAEAGWLAALRDPQIGRAIQAIHEDPGGDWTVESLATVAAMSRSAFSDRFGELVSSTPMQYVTDVRMRQAHQLLQSDRTVAEVAYLVGYGSQAAFSRAFKRIHGVAPGAYRSRLTDQIA